MTKIKIDKLIRSRRRTLALLVTQEAELVVRAPLFTPRLVIRRFVEEKRSWIKKKLDAAQKKKLVSRQFALGEEFLYLGRVYPLKIVKGRNITLTNFLELPFIFLPKAKVCLIKWYKAQALKEISLRVSFYRELMGLKCPLVGVTSARKRWGSCGPGGKLNFSYRLIMAPLRVLDYVVVHELAHLKERNHSRKFYAEVRRILPDYKSRQKWLKENDASLSI